MAIDHQLIVKGGKSFCICGRWEPKLGESIRRGYDEHLLEVQARETATLPKMIEALKKVATDEVIQAGTEVVDKVGKMVHNYDGRGRSSMPIYTDDAAALVMLAAVALDLLKGALTEEQGGDSIADEGAQGPAKGDDHG